MGAPSQAKIAKRILLKHLREIRDERRRMNPLAFVKLNAPQRIMADAWAEPGIHTMGAVGANQSGKSTGGAFLTISSALSTTIDAWRTLPTQPSRLIAWAKGRPKKKIWCITTTFKKSVQGQQLEWNDWCPRCLIKRPKSPYTADRGFNGQAITLVNGTVILFKSAEQGLTEFETERVNEIWVDETVPEAVFTRLLARMIAKAGRLLITTIPDQAWLYDLFVESGDPGVRWVGLRLDDNLDNLSDSGVERFKTGLQRMSDDEYRMRVEGEWIFMAGLVYGREFGPWNLVERQHITSQPWWNSCTNVVWCDPGFTNPCAVLFVKIAPDDNRTHYYHDIIYETGQTPPHIAAAIKAKVGDRKIQVYGIDPAALQNHMGQEVTVYDQFRKAGIPFQTTREIVPTADKLLVNSGILKMKSWLKPREGPPRIKILSDLEPIKNELRRYKWRDVDAATGQMLGDKELPVQAWDHALDCARWDTAADLAYVPPPAPEPGRDSPWRHHLDEERASKISRSRKRLIPK